MVGRRKMWFKISPSNIMYRHHIMNSLTFSKYLKLFSIEIPSIFFYVSIKKARHHSHIPSGWTTLVNHKNKKCTKNPNVLECPKPIWFQLIGIRMVQIYVGFRCYNHPINMVINFYGEKILFADIVCVTHFNRNKYRSLFATRHLFYNKNCITSAEQYHSNYGKNKCWKNGYSKWIFAMAKINRVRVLNKFSPAALPWCHRVKINI